MPLTRGNNNKCEVNAWGGGGGGEGDRVFEGNLAGEPE